METYRVEHDTMGEIEVPIRRLWGAQTQRAIAHFAISSERMPAELLLALAAIKRSCARANAALGILEADTAAAIAQAATEICDGQHLEEFPLHVWQTGSGTQSNMNMNEVLANRASLLLGGPVGTGRRVHPNDEVNLGQSTNDVFPSAMHVAAVLALKTRLLPALRNLERTLTARTLAFHALIKIGRTHLQDATPLTLGQEFSGYASQLSHCESLIDTALSPLLALAVGGTAVGTGLNTHPDFAEGVVSDLRDTFGLPFRSATNKFAALAAHDELVAAHGALKTLATALFKIANDIRWLASGPRCGLGELNLPENEPGSSIMPGKVNPTQCEALTMLCCQVLGNDVSLSIGAASGNFELNAFKPLIAYNFLQSVRLLTDGMASFDRYCAEGITANVPRMAQFVEQSLMLATALTPHIGYDQAAKIAKSAHRTGSTLREAAVASGVVTDAQFDEWVRPHQMTGYLSRPQQER